MIPLAAYLLLFVAVGVGFIFIHLVAGKLIRPNRPDPEKGTIYECGEPTIGTAWVQFDLRFYVVALLFVIFDVEVAFFFPWAEMFGKANAVATAKKPSGDNAKEYRDFAALVLDVAPPASSSEHQRREVERFQALLARNPDGSFVFDDDALKNRVRDQEALRQKGAKAKLTSQEAIETTFQGPLKYREFEKTQDAARMFSIMALGEVLVFFGVLLVGFAYLWRRGDLQWVRSTAAERPEAPPPPVEAKRETVGAGEHS